MLGVLHVYAHEVAELLGPLDDPQEVPITEVRVDVEPQLGQFQRDGGLRLVCVDLSQARGVLGRRHLGLGTIGHAFAEEVEGDPESLPVQVTGHRQRFFRGVAGHEAS